MQAVRLSGYHNTRIERRFNIMKSVILFFKVNSEHIGSFNTVVSGIEPDLPSTRWACGQTLYHYPHYLPQGQPVVRVGAVPTIVDARIRTWFPVGTG